MVPKIKTPKRKNIQNILKTQSKIWTQKKKTIPLHQIYDLRVHNSPVVVTAVLKVYQHESLCWGVVPVFQYQNVTWSDKTKSEKPKLSTLMIHALQLLQLLPRLI